MRLSLGSRFALIYAGSLAAAALGVFTALSILAQRETERQARNAVTMASQVMSRLLSADAASMQARCRLLTQSQGIGPLIVSGDTRTMVDYLKDQRAPLGVDGVALVGRTGTLLGTSDDTRYAPLAGPLQALPRDRPWNGVVLQNGRTRFVVQTPVADPASGAFQGSLLAFRDIDRSMAVDLSRMVAADIVFTWDGSAIASSHPGRAEPCFESHSDVPGDLTSGRFGLTVRLPRSVLLSGLDLQRAATGGVFGMALLLGVLGAFRLAHNLTRPLERVVDAARTVRSGAWPEPLPAVGRDELGLLESVFNEMTSALHDNQLVAIQALAATVDARDAYTSGHSSRVAEVAQRLAQALGLDSDTVERVHTIGTLHDIGKLSIPDTILLKDSGLTAIERGIIETHPVRSAEIVGQVPSLKAAIPGILHHHERWDGGGYPAGLAGVAIPLEARIVTLADTFDALTSDRPYRKGWDCERALSEIVRGSGTQFDPNLVPAFVSMWPAVERARAA